MKPVLQALLLADHVYEDKSGKKIIAGTFNRIVFSSKQPIKEIETPDGSKRQVLLGGMQSGSPYVYMSLTDVCEGTRLQLQFVNITKNTALLGTDIEVKCEDRLRTGPVRISVSGEQGTLFAGWLRHAALVEDREVV